MHTSGPSDALRVGMRAVVRHRIEEGQTDAVGEVLAVDEVSVTIDARGGPRVIPRAQVVLAKEVPPRPTRRGAPHRAISLGDLEAIMVPPWPAPAPPAGPTEVVVPGPAGFAADDDPLVVDLVSRGHRVVYRSVVLTAAVRQILATASGTPGTAVPGAVRLTPAPPSSWPGGVGAVRPDASPPSSWPGGAPAAPSQGGAPAAPSQSSAPVPSASGAPVPSASGTPTPPVDPPEQLFASIWVEGRPAGVARVAFASMWAGTSGVEVRAEVRRRGVGGALLAAVAEASRARGILSMYAEVEEGQVAARALFERFGFGVHHDRLHLRG